MDDRTPIFLICTILVLVTILIVAAMRSFTSVKQAQARLAAESSYRSLAERVVQTEEKGAASLEMVRRDVAELAARLGRIETVLKDVE
jgi:archaellum component FlaF (FlaF/FlaG flagellin family)